MPSQMIRPHKHTVWYKTQLTSEAAVDVAGHDRTERSYPAWTWHASAGSVSSDSSSRTISRRCRTARKPNLYRRVTTDADYVCFSCGKRTYKTDSRGWRRRCDDASTSLDSFPNDAVPKISHQPTSDRSWKCIFVWTTRILPTTLLPIFWLPVPGKHIYVIVREIKLHPLTFVNTIRWLSSPTALKASCRL